MADVGLSHRIHLLWEACCVPDGRPPAGMPPSSVSWKCAAGHKPSKASTQGEGECQLHKVSGLKSTWARGHLTEEWSGPQDKRWPWEGTAGDRGARKRHLPPGHCAHVHLGEGGRQGMSVHICPQQEWALQGQVWHDQGSCLMAPMLCAESQ